MNRLIANFKQEMISYGIGGAEVKHLFFPKFTLKMTEKIHARLKLSLFLFYQIKRAIFYEIIEAAL